MARQVVVSRTLAERMAQARREKGVREWRDVRRAEIAKAAGVDPSMVTLYEQGKSVPGESVLERLAKFYGVTPAFLRYGVVTEPQHEPVRRGVGVIVAGQGAAKKKEA